MPLLLLRTGAGNVAEWEVDIKVRRNGRLVKRESALADNPRDALYFAKNDLMLWAEDHPDAKESE